MKMLFMNNKILLDLVHEQFELILELISFISIFLINTYAVKSVTWLSYIINQFHLIFFQNQIIYQSMKLIFCDNFLILIISCIKIWWRFFQSFLLDVVVLYTWDCSQFLRNDYCSETTRFLNEVLRVYVILK